MIVGTDAVCPVCKQSDATQRVPLVVGVEKNSLNEREGLALDAQRQSGKTQDMAAPAQGTWAQVAEQLAPPVKPQADAKSTNRVLWGALVIGLVLFVLAYFVGQSNIQVLGAAFPAFCLFWLVIAFGVALVIFYTRSSQTKDAPADANWTRQNALWNSLYYCARDNVVFQPGKPQSVPAADWTKFPG